MLDRALEIATDFVDAAGPDHPLVESMIQANDSFAAAVTGTPQDSRDWRASALAVFAAAGSAPEHPAVDAHLTLLVTSLVELSDSLGMNWTPTPALRRAAGL